MSSSSVFENSYSVLTYIKQINIYMYSWEDGRSGAMFQIQMGGIYKTFTQAQHPPQPPQINLTHSPPLALPNFCKAAPSIHTMAPFTIHLKLLFTFGQLLSHSSLVIVAWKQLPGHHCCIPAQGS